jgi:hypothetical protein
MRLNMRSFFLVPVMSILTACGTSPERLIRPHVFERETRPNILVIMTDDQGYSDVGYNGNPLLETPRIDGLAQGGRHLCPHGLRQWPGDVLKADGGARGNPACCRREEKGLSAHCSANSLSLLAM